MFTTIQIDFKKFSILQGKKDVNIKTIIFKINPVMPVNNINKYGGNISISIKTLEYTIKKDVIPVKDINIINIGMKAK